MKVVVRNNEKVFKYEKHKFSFGVKSAIGLYVGCIFLFCLSIYISYLLDGNAGTFIAGIVFSALICDIASLIIVILEIYLYKNFYSEIRNMLILQVAFLLFFIIII